MLTSDLVSFLAFRLERSLLESHEILHLPSKGRDNESLPTPERSLPPTVKSLPFILLDGSALSETCKQASISRCLIHW